MATPNYSIDYNDKRFTQVEDAKQDALNEMNDKYNGMIDQSDKFYQSQIDAANQYAEQQKQLQQEHTDFAIEKVEQQKEQAEKSYKKEQAGAYVDWQKQSDQYGAKAEQLASSGLQNTGYSESSQVSMYNTYQNRVGTARESFNQAILNYDNAIKDAQLQNNAALAEIAYNALKTQLELSLQGFQYRNQLILEQLNQKQNIDNTYYQRWQDVLSQMNTENSLAEQVRQYNESLAEQRRQYNETLAFQKKQAAQEQANWEKEYALSKKAYSSSSSGSSSSKVKLTNSSSSSNSKLTDSSSKLKSSGKTVNDLFGGSAPSNYRSKQIVTDGSKYYVEVNGKYVDVTQAYKNSSRMTSFWNKYVKG